MNYLVLILSGIIGFLIYYIYKKQTTKICPHCGERIKIKAILCRYCRSDLLTPAQAIAHKIEQIKTDLVTPVELIDNNLKKMSTMASLTVSKKVLIAQIFVLQGIKLLSKSRK